ncbi:hypothetical protein C8J57DRAFT_1531219 [Mycena rebaudengoi]|nr:hypothetical protein C8J57DRAFT_1531219 [Mycena rebaudengoi]
MDLVDFETKINQLRLVEVGVKVSKGMLFLASFLTSLLTCITSAPSNSKLGEENVLLLATIARAKLLYGDVEGTKTDMDKAWAVLDRLEGAENGVNVAPDIGRSRQHPT